MDPRMMGFKAASVTDLGDGFTSMAFVAKNGTRTYGLYLRDVVQMVTRDAGELARVHDLMCAGLNVNDAVMALHGGR